MIERRNLLLLLVGLQAHVLGLGAGAAWARGDGDNGGDDDGDHGGEDDGDHGGEDDGDHGGDDDGDHGGEDDGGHGGDDDGDHGGEDDDSPDDPGEDDNSPDDHDSPDDAPGAGRVVQARQRNGNLAIAYSDGWRERIRNGRYVLTDPNGNTVARRAARNTDFRRMARTMAGR